MNRGIGKYHLYGDAAIIRADSSPVLYHLYCIHLFQVAIETYASEHEEAWQEISLPGSQ